MVSIMDLVIGYALGLIPVIFFVLGWKSQKNIKDYGVISPKIDRMFHKHQDIIVNTPEREIEIEREMREEGIKERPEDLLDESY